MMMFLGFLLGVICGAILMIVVDPPVIVHRD